MTSPDLDDCDTPAEVLAFARAERAAADVAEVRVLEAAVAWAGMHVVDALDEAACWPGFEGQIAIAGPGAPLVREFAHHELAVALGLSSEAGRVLLGEAVELAHRLPATWALVRAGRLQAWRGRRIARATHDLPLAGAAFVDQHVAAVAGRVGGRALDRLVEEARTRFDPDAAEQRRRDAADGRHVGIHTEQVSFDGTCQVEAELDLADALDLDEALTAGAARLKALGCEASPDARRAIAAGELARRQATLDLDADLETRTDGDAARSTRKPTKARQVVLHVHVSAAALQGTGLHLARVENTRSFVCADQVRDWCGNPDADVVVKPVIDLDGHTHTDAYEAPDRLLRRLRAASPTCVFPWCARSARRCDTDHVTPYDPERPDAGPTCDCNLAPLCRTHHRLKTHTRWSYDKLDQTTFLWRSPTGIHVRRDHTGTVLIEPAPADLHDTGGTDITGGTGTGHPPDQ